MNKNLKALIAPATLVGLLVLPLVAHADDRLIKDRQHNQAERIRNGQRNGELTGREAAQLRERAAQIRLDKERAERSGGNFSSSEKRRIQDKLDRLSQDIKRQKDDRQQVGYGSYRPGYNGYRPGPSRPGINERQRWQQEQIAHGRRTGVLTPGEASALRAREARVNYLEARLRNSNGRLSGSERARLQRELTDLRQAIYRQSTDRQYGRR